MNLLQTPPDSGDSAADDEHESPVDAPRTIVADHYQIESDQPIGSGGMALVYRGRDLRTRRQVALKTLKPEWVADPAARSRFRHEARTMAFLAHPNVARVFDLWEPDDASQPWVVLELLQGPSLRQELDLHGPMDIDRVAHLLRQIASALDHLHGRGLCHLDVKPQNLLFAEPMIIKLIDFGIAQPTGSSSRIEGIQAFGSPAYISPEQARHSRGVDIRSDIYSLGCSLYHMIAGHPPFPEGNLAEKIYSHQLREAEPLADLVPGVPPELSALVHRCLRKNPEDRYATARELADRLSKFVTDESLATTIELNRSATAETPATRRARAIASAFCAGLARTPLSVTCPPWASISIRWPDRALLVRSESATRFAVN